MKPTLLLTIAACACARALALALTANAELHAHSELEPTTGAATMQPGLVFEAGGMSECIEDGGELYAAWLYRSFIGLELHLTLCARRGLYQ